MFVAIFIAAIVVAVMVHEAGHFVTARMFGMKAERFFFGFGPTLWSTRRGETEYGVKAIPAGGFVKIAGMTPWEPADPADDGRLFYQQPWWQRAIVLVAGAATHFVLAALLLWAALSFIGLPTDLTNVVAATTPDSPAERAGLQPEDVVVAVDGQPTADFDDVRDAIAPRAGDTVTLTVDPAGGRLADDRRDVEVVLDVPHPDGGDVGFLGVAPLVREVPMGALGGARAVLSGDFSLGRLVGVTVQGLGQVFSLEGLSSFFASVDDEGPRSAEGPVSLVGVGQAVSALGNQGDVFAVLALLAQLNVVLGVLNLLPLPPLDGGHLAVMTVEEAVHGVRRLRGHRGDRWRLNPAVVTPVALAVIAFFVVLSLTALYVDLTKPASELFQ